MASSIHSAEKRLYEKLGMENPNKPKVYTSTVKEGPTIHKVRVIAHDGSKKIPPPVAAKPIFYKASIQQQKVPEKAKPSSASVGAGNSQAKLGTKSMEDELADLTDLLVKNLDNTSDPDFYGICYKCRKNVSGEGNGCTAMSNIYHTDCFLCKTCQTKLTGKEFYCVEDEPYCETCYFDSLEECVTCAKKITERILRAQGFSYHPECFTCSVCSSNLDNVPFTVDATNQVHCVECYQLKFSPRCAACQKLILPENEKGETVHIVSMQKNFHVACYKCEDCGILLSSETGQGCYPLDGHLLCQLCNGKRVQRMTSDLTPEPSTEL
ncbi:lipoma-preferred partner homolog [Rhopilema esculentum]|uniref:lipoma-preferred partner homolog n=1 Tax=Rhopilema esculentum TaxID=499914 RepID=UPI0031E10D76